MNIAGFIIKAFYKGRQWSESKIKWVTMICKTSRENLQETLQDKIIWQSIWTTANLVYHRDKVMTSVIQWKKKATLTSFDCWLKCSLFQHIKIASKVVPCVFPIRHKEGFKTMREYPCAIQACKGNRQVHKWSMYLVPLDFKRIWNFKYFCYLGT